MLTEASLAERYHVARPTAKAAIERLVADGLVTRARRGAGAAVRTLTIADIEDLYATRILVEGAVNARLAELRSHVTAAQEANARLRTAAESGDAPGIVAADVAFHRALVAEHGSERLARLHDLLMGEAHFCMARVQEWQLLGAATIAAEHEGIVASVQSGDSVLAQTRTTSHLDAARSRLLQHLTGG